MCCCVMRSAFDRRAEPERSESGCGEAQCGCAKWRGRGIGQRNIMYRSSMKSSCYYDR